MSEGSLARFPLLEMSINVSSDELLPISASRIRATCKAACVRAVSLVYAFASTAIANARMRAHTHTHITRAHKRTHAHCTY